MDHVMNIPTLPKWPRPLPALTSCRAPATVPLPTLECVAVSLRALRHILCVPALVQGLSAWRGAQPCLNEQVKKVFLKEACDHRLSSLSEQYSYSSSMRLEISLVRKQTGGTFLCPRLRGANWLPSPRSVLCKYSSGESCFSKIRQDKESF